MGRRLKNTRSKIQSRSSFYHRLFIVVRHDDHIDLKKAAVHQLYVVPFKTLICRFASEKVNVVTSMVVEIR